MPQNRVTAYSDVKVYGAGGALTFDLLFIQRVRNKFKYGRVVSLELRTKWVAATGSAGSRGEVLFNAITGIEFKDSAGPRTLSNGLDLHMKNVEEIAGYRGPRDMAASQTTANNQTHHLDLHPVEVQSELDEEDHGILLSDIGDTGSVTLTLAAIAALSTNGATIDAATSFQLIAEMEEATPGRQYPRTVIMGYPNVVSPIASRFNVKGSLRSLIVHAGAGAVITPTPLTEQNWMIPDLEYGQGLPSTFLQHKYARRGTAAVRDNAGVIATDDPFMSGLAVPLWTANRGQKVSDMPDLDTVGIQNDGTVPTSPPSRVVITTVVDRPAQLVADSLAVRGAPSPSVDQVKALYGSKGHIAGAGGRKIDKRIGRLARRLPIVIKP